MLSSAPRFSAVLMKYSQASAGAIRVTTSASSCSMNSVCSPSEQRMMQSLFIRADLAKSTWTIGFWPRERVKTELPLHFNISVVGCEFLDLAVAHQIDAAIANVSNRDFLIAENACTQSGAHPAEFGFDPEVVNVEIGFFENLVEDLVGFLSSRGGLKSIQGNVDRHAAGDLAGAEATHSIRNRGDGAVNEPVLLTFRLPEPDRIIHGSIAAVADRV